MFIAQFLIRLILKGVGVNRIKMQSIVRSYSFYIFSGRLTTAPAQKYQQDLMHYFFKSYFNWAAAYAVLALGIAAVVRLVNTEHVDSQTR